MIVYIEMNKVFCLLDVGFMFLYIVVIKYMFYVFVENYLFYIICWFLLI